MENAPKPQGSTASPDKDDAAVTTPSVVPAGRGTSTHRVGVDTQLLSPTEGDRVPPVSSRDGDTLASALGELGLSGDLNDLSTVGDDEYDIDALLAEDNDDEVGGNSHRLFSGDDHGVGDGDDDDGDNDESDVAIHEKLPPFADEENRQLHSEIKKNQKDLGKAREQHEENEERLKIMQDHMRNVDHEIQHTRALLEIKRKEIEQEKHQKLLALRETSRLNSDTEKTETELDEYQTKLNSMRNEMFLSNEKLAKFKVKMNWNQEELDNWMLASKQKEEDAMALAAYKHADDTQIKNLNVTLKKLADTVEKTEDKLTGTVVETQTLQLELEKLGEEYQSAHGERDDVIAQWNESTKAIMKRDEDLAALAERIAESKTALRKLTDDVAEHDEQLQEENATNKKIETSITVDTRSLEGARATLSAANSTLVESKDSAQLHENELARTKSEINQTTRETDNLADVNDARERKANAIADDFGNVKIRLEQALLDTGDLGSQSDRAEELHKDSKARLQAITRQEEKLREQVFQESQKLFANRQREAQLIADISGTDATLKNLQGNIAALDVKTLKQQEMLYKVEYQIQQLECKVARASGERSHEEMMMLEKKKEVLTEELKEQLDQQKKLETQVKRIKESLRAVHRKKIELAQEKEKLSEQIHETELQNDTAEILLGKLQRQRNELLVRADEQHLVAKKLHVKLAEKADQVFALDNRKRQLEFSMESRDKEIGANRTLQESELRLLQASKRDSTIEMKQREMTVDKLKAKYRTIASKLRGTDPEAAELSQAYYIVRAAQAREELRLRGDSLNQQVKTAEKELLMLSKSLKHLNAQNQSYRQSFGKVNPRGPEARKRAELENQLRTVSDTLYKKRSAARDLESEVGERARLSRELESDAEMLEQSISKRRDKREDIEMALAELRAELRAASDKAEVARVEFRDRCGVTEGEETVEEKMFKESEALLRHAMLMDVIKEFVADHPNVRDAAWNSLKQDCNIDLYSEPSHDQQVRAVEVQFQERSRHVLHQKEAELATRNDTPMGMTPVVVGSAECQGEGLEGGQHTPGRRDIPTPAGDSEMGESETDEVRERFMSRMEGEERATKSGKTTPCDDGKEGMSRVDILRTDEQGEVDM